MKRVEKPWGYEPWWAQTNRYVGKILHINAGHKGLQVAQESCSWYAYHVR